MGEEVIGGVKDVTSRLLLCTSVRPVMTDPITGTCRRSESGREDGEVSLGISEKAMDVSVWPSGSRSGLQTFIRACEFEFSPASR